MTGFTWELVELGRTEGSRRHQTISSHNVGFLIPTLESPSHRLVGGGVDFSGSESLYG